MWNFEWGCCGGGGNDGLGLIWCLIFWCGMCSIWK